MGGGAGLRGGEAAAGLVGGEEEGGGERGRGEGEEVEGYEEEFVEGADGEEDVLVWGLLGCRGSDACGRGRRTLLV